MSARDLAPPVIALLPADAPFTPAQRAWLDGFFVALLSRLATAAPAAPAPKPGPALHVLYASQTGTAEGLAKKLAKEAKGKGFDARAGDLGAISPAALATLGHAVVIASTHGEGDPPDSVGAFVAALDEVPAGALAGLSYAVLALGDRNYAKFCGFGRALDERLEALGGARLAARVEADTDVAEPFARFRAALWPALPTSLAPDSLGASTTGPEVSGKPAQSDGVDDEGEAKWHRGRPFPALLRSQRKLSGAGSAKDVRHVVLSLAGSGLEYAPGDALGVWPRQSPALVEDALALAGLSGDTAAVVDDHVLALAEVLATRREIARLRPTTVIKFARLSGDARLLAMTEPERSAELDAFLHGKDMVDLMRRFPGVVRDAHTLVSILPPLAPRLYSISSSPLAFPDEVHLTVATVRFEAEGRMRGGVASTYFADLLAADDPAPVYVHRNTRFRLPEDPGTPIVMIGPGTGIAPFRAFLHHRRAQRLTTRSWLFFGDQHERSDYLYRDELESFVAARELTRLDLAFSRDQDERIYVQKRMLEAGRDLWSWIEEGATVYVCGDADRMARDVDAALCSIISTHGRRSSAKAKLHLREMAATGRYVRDVY